MLQLLKKLPLHRSATPADILYIFVRTPPNRAAEPKSERFARIGTLFSDFRVRFGPFLRDSSGYHQVFLLSGMRSRSRAGGEKSGAECGVEPEPTGHSFGAGGGILHRTGVGTKGVQISPTVRGVEQGRSRSRSTAPVPETPGPFSRSWS